MSEAMIRVSDLRKSFTVHLQGGIELPVLDGAAFTVNRGDGLVLAGDSGSGKSTLLRCLYANYLPGTGRVEVRHRGEWVDLAGAPARTVLAVRRHTIGYVSQFLRAIPRVPAIDLVAEPLLALGRDAAGARAQAGALLERLRIPERLWSLPPATFSGGEQQRVNIARGFVADHPVLLLDEPTAALDAANRDIVVALINEARTRGTAVVGIFHDADVRAAVCNRAYDVTAAREAA